MTVTARSAVTQALNWACWTHLLSMRHITAFLQLGTLPASLTLHLGHSTQQNHPRGAPVCKNCGSRYAAERTQFCSMRGETRSRALPCSTSAWIFAALHLPLDDHEGALQILHSREKAKFAKTESGENKDPQYQCPTRKSVVQNKEDNLSNDTALDRESHSFIISINVLTCCPPQQHCCYWWRAQLWVWTRHFRLGVQVLSRGPDNWLPFLYLLLQESWPGPLPHVHSRQAFF